jgi:hypothetical protein
LQKDYVPDTLAYMERMKTKYVSERKGEWKTPSGRTRNTWEILKYEIKHSAYGGGKRRVQGSGGKT